MCPSDPLDRGSKDNVPSAGIQLCCGPPREDTRGRTVDLHALRHTFGTHLNRNGVPSRTAQAAMRDSSLNLTMLARRGKNVYTAPTPLEVAGDLPEETAALLVVNWGRHGTVLRLMKYHLMP